MKRQIGKPWRRGPAIVRPARFRSDSLFLLLCFAIGVVTSVWAAHQ